MSLDLEYYDWLIVENGFHPDKNREMESIFSIGNGKMGQRANFEEAFSGDSLQGSYIGGVYYPDRTRVGWWKNGYPEYFAKVINAINWIGIDVSINNQELDLAKCRILDFKRTLNMKEGFLERTFRVELPNGNRVGVHSTRFLSIVDTSAGAIKYSITAENFDGEITIKPYLDLDVKNEDSNYNEKFWEEEPGEINKEEAIIIGKTKKLDFRVCTAMYSNLFCDGKQLKTEPEPIRKPKYLAWNYKVPVKQNEEVSLYKYVINKSSLDHTEASLVENTSSRLKHIFKKGFQQMLTEQKEAWAAKWLESDIRIEGDTAAQQGIRFNIFQLNQTYTGEDERLNIGPKGFTGEKYGGSTYWDTEAYALPFYLSTAGKEVARNLLLYRYKHLERAIENATKLGFNNGAALYPMVTMNGEECHNEWEITFEEIHRNGAIAFAIFNYIRYTGDNEYMADYGLEVLIGISRFWSQRTTFSQKKQKYVILGVTGPNEYENNVNNNWYTNMIAVWTLKYTNENLINLKQENPEKYKALTDKLQFNQDKETSRWEAIIQNMHSPYSPMHNLFLQQDDYLDKENITKKDLVPTERPLNQNWSWDRILRSPFIKQADVLQGLYFFENKYDIETIKRHFNYYEARTVHESSLSACIHAIVAAKIKDIDRSYKLYLRTSRLDLDDYNHEVKEGLHITSMAGTWMTVVEGFGGMRVKNNVLSFYPQIPKNWESYSFNIRFRGNLLSILVNKHIIISNKDGAKLKVIVFDNTYDIDKNSNISIHISSMIPTS